MKTDLPAHLEADTRTWVLSVAERWVLDEHHERLLILAACCWDRQRRAEQAIIDNGFTLEDNYGQIRQNPAVAVEKEARNGFLKAIKQLNLADIENAKPPAWGPMPASKK